MAIGRVNITSSMITNTSGNWQQKSQWQDISSTTNNTISGVLSDKYLYTAFTCTTTGSVNYTVVVTGGTGNVIINGTTYALDTAVSIASGIQCNITFISGTSKTTTYGYGTFRIDITSNNSLLTFSANTHSDLVYNYCSLLWLVTNTSALTTLILGTLTSKYHCAHLESVSILNSTSTLTANFSGCSSLQSITVPSNIISIANFNLQNCNSLSYIDLPSAITTIPSWIFNGDIMLQKIMIPNNVTSIGDGAFCGNSLLQSITIPDSITTIGAQTFQNCYSLQSLTLPSTVTSIGTQAITNCQSLTVLNISNISINNLDFNGVGCYNLSTFNAPNITFTRLQLQGTSSVKAMLSSVIINTNSTFSSTTTPQVDISYTNMSENSVVNLFNQLPTISGKTIKVTGCTGTSNLTASDLLIATNKGWTVTQ